MTPVPTDDLQEAIHRSLDGLLRALELEPVAEDRFRVLAEPGRFDRIFGGQSLAQALLAAAATVEGKAPNSLHAYFVEAGEPGEPLELDVDRVRDGRSMATRRVTVHQGDRALLVAIASFHADVAEVVPRADRPPAVPPPAEVPVLQSWADEGSRTWVDRPPPLDMRIGEAPAFMGGAAATGPRSHWMRLPRPVGDSALLQAALLTYASDYLLLDMAFRSHPDGYVPGTTGTSLDHAIWLHGPVRFDEWHLHTQETVVLAGTRGTVRGSIHDRDGRLVASVVQEVLVRR